MWRWIGYFFGALTAVVLAFDGYRFYDTGLYKPASLGATWAAVDIASLNISQAAVQRYVSPWLWDPAIQTILTAPAWLVLAIIGVIAFANDALRRRGQH
ncbi:MAG: hypothetical protein OEQ29_02340 [Alphaproteobacteria bacterium]|nr:hypothetical protein [Alphaproteobacteria bacterium]